MAAVLPLRRSDNCRKPSPAATASDPPASGRVGVVGRGEAIFPDVRLKIKLKGLGSAIEEKELVCVAG